MGDAFSRARRQGGRDTADKLEIQRIIALPIVRDLDEATIEAFCAEEVDARWFEEGFRLFPVQAQAVLAWDLYGGVFGPVGVGWGKTLITLMIANRAFRAGEIERSVLYVPPQVYEQLVQTDIAWARKRVGLSVPFHLLGGRSLDERRRMAGSGKAGCYIMPYSLLSTKDAETLLSGDELNPPANQRAIDGIRPQLLLLDEAHRVKNQKAACTARLRRFITAYQPRVVALSGTITAKTIKDYHYLIAQALRDNCPLPLSESLAENWSYVLDPEKPGEGWDSGRSSKTGPLSPLLNWARRYFPGEKLPDGIAGFRQAYKRRLVTTPGVASTGDADIGVSLTIMNRPVEKYKEVEGWAQLDKHIQELYDLCISPSGDEIEHQFHTWRYHFELSAGFYYRQRWPEIEELTRRGLSEDEAVAYLEQAMLHHEAQQLYHRDLRRWIEYNGRPGLDTPLLVAGNMAKKGDQEVNKKLYGLWREMKDLEFRGMPERISEPVRICPYKINHAVAWAKEIKGGGLIWYHHDDLGRWVFEALKEAGADAMWCPAESVKRGSNAAIGDAKNAGKVVVASIGGHGTGKNLQHFQEQFYMQFPRQAVTVEQVLGRTHRNGQQADELLPVLCNTTEFDHQNLWACLIESLYIHQTTGARQKLIYASWSPLPKRYPEDFLRERGFIDIPQLDADARARLEEKFGKISVDPKRSAG